MITLWKYMPTSQPGELQPVVLDVKPQKLDNLTDQLPTGVYTTFRTYHKYSALNLKAHIERLEQSAALKYKPLDIDEKLFRQHLRRALQEHPAGDNRVRVIIAWAGSDDSPEIYFALEGLSTPSQELYQSGVRVKTILLSRDNPEAKATDFIHQTLKLREEITNGLNELLMVDENGAILEGLSSNFFAIHGDTLFTRAEGILLGITRDLVLQIAENIPLALRYEAVNITDLSEMDEAFITSTSRRVLPVVRVDDILIGSGTPGRITKMILERYEHEVERLIQPI